MTDSRNEFQLNYKSIDHFMADVPPGSFQRGRRIKVKLSDHTDYVFTFVSTQGDRINGLSALNGRMVYIDLDTMILHEQAEA